MSLTKPRSVPLQLGCPGHRHTHLCLYNDMKLVGHDQFDVGEASIIGVALQLNPHFMGRDRESEPVQERPQKSGASAQSPAQRKGCRILIATEE